MILTLKWLTYIHSRFSDRYYVTWSRKFRNFIYSDRFVTHKNIKRDTWHLWQTKNINVTFVTDRFVTHKKMWHMTCGICYTLIIWHFWQTDVWHTKNVTREVCNTQKPDTWYLTFVTDKFITHKECDMCDRHEWQTDLWHTKIVMCDICDT